MLKGWYAIKQKNQTKPNLSCSADFMRTVPFMLNRSNSAWKPFLE